MRFRAILLFGAPGSGKGTQGKILGQVPNFVHYSCGDAFRSLRVDSPLGRTFMEYASKGSLVPDEPTIALWKQSVNGLAGTGRYNPEADTLLLDGIPRKPMRLSLEPKVIPGVPFSTKTAPIPAAPGASDRRQ